MSPSDYIHFSTPRMPDKKTEFQLQYLIIL